MLWRRGIVQWRPILQTCVLVINSPLLILHSIKSAQKTLLCHRDRVPMWLGGIILDSACNYSTRRLVSSPLDDLCIDIWISVMIITEPRWQRDRVQQCTTFGPTFVTILLSQWVSSTSVNSSLAAIGNTAVPPARQINSVCSWDFSFILVSPMFSATFSWLCHSPRVSTSPCQSFKLE